MKKLTLIMLFILAAALCGTKANAQFDQTLFNDFFQKFQAANTARMAGEFDKSIGLFEGLLDEKYASQPSLVDMQAGVHQLLGMLLSTYLNKQDDALIEYGKALQMMLEKPIVDDPSMAQMNAAQESRIAATYRLMGDWENMAAHEKKTLEYYNVYWTSEQPYKMEQADYNRTVGADYYYLGLAYKNAGDEQNSKASYGKAAELYESLLSGKHLPDVDMMLSYIYRELGQPDKCIEYYQSWLKAKEAEPDRTETEKLMMDISRIALAHYLFDAGKFGEAKDELDKTIAAAEKLNWTSDLWRSWHLKGLVFEKTGDKDSALAAYEKSIEVIESQRSGLGAGDDRASFLEIHISVYRDIIRLLIDMVRPDDALKYLERSKARSFLDMLGGRDIGRRTPEETSVVKQQLEIQKEINGLAMSLTTSGAGTRGAATGEGDAGTKMRAAKMRYAELMGKVKKMNPEFTSVVSVNPPEISDIRASLGEAVLLEFYPSDDALYVWAVKKDDSTMRKSDTGSEAIKNQVKTLRSKITRGTLDDSYVSTSKKLYDILIAPVEDLLPPEGGNVIIVPHGALHYLPFNALLKGDAFLIDRFVVTLSPSASTLKYIADKERPDSGGLLALGNPVTPFADLPAAADEAKAISADFKQSDVFIGDKAVKSLLEGDKAAKAGVIHIASHGLFYPDKPMLSAIALSGGGAGENYDGLLQVHEIFGLKLSSANLVTLSACETGLASISGGDELVGLSRAFIYAGAPRVIVSLWSVNDASTGELMKNLYADRGAGAAAALRQAQLKLKSNPEFAHPFFWAPFQLIGDWK